MQRLQEIHVSLNINISGNFYIDEIVLRESGVRNFDKYSVVPGSQYFTPDFFVGDEVYSQIEKIKSKL